MSLLYVQIEEVEEDLVMQVRLSIPDCVFAIQT